VESWLAAENEEGVLAATADRMVFEEGEGEDASEDDDDCFFSRGLFSTSKRMDSIGHHCASVSLIAIVAHMLMEMRLGVVTEEGGGGVVFCGGSGGCSVEPVATTVAWKRGQIARRIWLGPC